MHESFSVEEFAQAYGNRFSFVPGMSGVGSRKRLFMMPCKALTAWS